MTDHALTTRSLAAFPLALRRSSSQHVRVSARRTPSFQGVHRPGCAASCVSVSASGVAGALPGPAQRMPCRARGRRQWRAPGSPRASRPAHAPAPTRRMGGTRCSTRSRRCSPCGARGRVSGGLAALTRSREPHRSATRPPCSPTGKSGSGGSAAPLARGSAASTMSAERGSGRAAVTAPTAGCPSAARDAWVTWRRSSVVSEVRAPPRPKNFSPRARVRPRTPRCCAASPPGAACCALAHVRRGLGQLLALRAGLPRCCRRSRTASHAAAAAQWRQRRVRRCLTSAS